MRQLALAGLFALAAAAAHAGGISGIYQTQPDDDGKFGMVQFDACGDSYCGVLIKSFDKDGKPMKSDNIGRKIVWDMKDKGDGSFAGGRIWQPSTGKEYKSKMKIEGNKLKVSGCVSVICRSQTWTKVK